MGTREFDVEDFGRPLTADRGLVDVAPDFDPQAVAAAIARRHGVSTAILLAPNTVAGFLVGRPLPGPAGSCSARFVTTAGARRRLGTSWVVGTTRRCWLG